ncbi:hypothetical protein ON010_g2267 [Phytophthora cinnamomi]|nr:hypothetical protein ON010_g2267 [Phytophthora cinnamomi]
MHKQPLVKPFEVTKPSLYLRSSARKHLGYDFGTAQRRTAGSAAAYDVEEPGVEHALLAQELDGPVHERDVELAAARAARRGAPHAQHICGPTRATSRWAAPATGWERRPTWASVARLLMSAASTRSAARAGACGSPRSKGARSSTVHEPPGDGLPRGQGLPGGGRSLLARLRHQAARGLAVRAGTHEHPAAAAQGSGPEGAQQAGQHGPRLPGEEQRDGLPAGQAGAHRADQGPQYRGGSARAALSDLLTFVCTSVAAQPQFLHEIERTMSVIAFKNPSESPLGHLLEQAQRRRVADEVNSAILRSQKQELEPMLPTMVQQFHYMEDQLETKLNRRSNGIRVEDSTR